MQYLFRSSQIKEPMFVGFFFLPFSTLPYCDFTTYMTDVFPDKKNSFSNIHHTLVKFTAVDRRFFFKQTHIVV